MSKRACRPGDVLYQSPKFYGDVYFEIKLENFEQITQPIREVKLEVIKATLSLKLFIPVSESGDIRNKFEDCKVMVMSENLRLNWGARADNNYRYKQRLELVSDINKGVSDLTALGETYGNILADLAKKNDETVTTIIKLRKQMCEAYPVEDV